MRPHVDAVALLTLDPLDPFRRHEGEQPVLLRGALLRGWDPACRQRRIAPRHGGGCGRDGGRRRGRRCGGSDGHGRSRGRCRCSRGRNRCRRRCPGAVAARCRRCGPRRMRFGRVWIRVVVGADRLRPGAPLGDAPVGPRGELGVQRLLVDAHVLRDFLPVHKVASLHRPRDAAVFAAVDPRGRLCIERLLVGAHVLVDLFPRHLERPRDPAVLADPPEVDREEQHQHERQREDVEHVPTEQRVGAHDRSTEQQEVGLLRDEG